ncbi:hypothetical protein ACO0SA_002998 [Hanseniaspora valbyensis]
MLNQNNNNNKTMKDEILIDSTLFKKNSNQNAKKKNRLVLGNPTGEIIPQTLTVNDHSPNSATTSTANTNNNNNNTSDSSRTRSHTVASALSNVGFRSIVHSNSATSSPELANQNLQGPYSSKSETKSKKSGTRLNATFSSHNSSIASSLNSPSSTPSSSLFFEKDEFNDDYGDNNDLSKKGKLDQNAKKTFYKLFGRNRDHYAKRNNDLKDIAETDHLHKNNKSPDSSSLMDNHHHYHYHHHFDDLLSLKDPEHELVNVSKILNHGGAHNNNSSNFNNNSNNNSSGLNTTNLDHLMKQDAMLSEREYHYMYDLLKNTTSLESQFVTLKPKLRSKILNNMIFIINDINYAVINNDHMLPKMENLHKIILLFIKLTFLDFGISYDADPQNNIQNDKSKKNINNGSYKNSNGNLSGSTSNSSISSNTVHAYSSSSSSSFSNGTSPVNGKLLHSVLSAETSSDLFETKNMSSHKLEFITKKFYKFIMKFYNKIFKDLVYMIENQLIYENNDEKILNNSIKRLNLIWYNFNFHYIPDIMILNHEFDVFTKTYLEKFELERKKSDLKMLLLETFRDCVIMPIFENYDSLYFKQFLSKQQELNNSDKLVFLQCLGYSIRNK